MQAVATKLDPSGIHVRWDEGLANRWRQSGYWLDTTLAALMRGLASRQGERVMLIEGERSWTVASVWNEARTLASALLAQGLKPGSVISYQIPNWYEGCIINIAAAAIGAAVNPLVPIYRDNELRFMLDDVKTSVFIVPERFRGTEYALMALRVREQLNQKMEVIVLRGSAPGCQSYDSLLSRGEQERPLPQVDPDSIYVLMHTSGTTGRAKCVLHTHNTFLVQGKVHAQELQQAEGGDVHIVASPISHVSGMVLANVIPAFVGARIVLMDRWDPQESIALIHRHGGTSLGGATPFLQQLLEAAQQKNDHLPTLRSTGTGGAAVPPDLIRGLHKWFPNTVSFRIYGCTEVPTATAGVAERADVEHGATTDGRIKHVDVRLVDAVTGEASPPGSEGEILLRGPQQMLGYLRAEDNADAFDSDGYFRTGDLGRIIDEHYLVITGRKKDLIIRSGENLSPKEIEDALHTHPAIAVAAVVGMPSRRTGEGVCAFVVLHKGNTIDLAEIDRHLATVGLSRRKVPERLEILPEMPVSAQGKIQKKALREMATALAANSEN